MSLCVAGCPPDKDFSTKCSQMMSISFILFSFTVSTTFRGGSGLDKFKWCRRLACLPALAPRVTGRLHGTIVGPTGRSDWSVRRSYRVNVSFDRSDRRSDV